MIKEQIENLLGLLPAPNAFLDSNLSATQQHAAWTPAARRAVCLTDPAFGYKFVRTFVERGEPLPRSGGLQIPTILQRAYDYLRGVGSDREIEDAIALSLDIAGSTRFVLEALLLCTVPAPDLEDRETASHRGEKQVIPMPLDQIAGHLQLQIGVVSAYHELFFNVQRRITDKPFITPIVYPRGWPETRTSKFRSYGSLREKLLIAGYEHGVDEVLSLAGYAPDEDLEGLSAMERARRFSKMVIAYAMDELKHGDSNSPLISAAAKILPKDDSGNGENSDLRRGLTAVGLNYSIADDIRRIQGPEIQEMLELQQESAPARDLQVKAYDDKESAA